MVRNDCNLKMLPDGNWSSGDEPVRPISNLHIVEDVSQRWLHFDLLVQLLDLGRSELQFAERLSAVVVQREQVGAGSFR